MRELAGALRQLHDELAPAETWPEARGLGLALASGRGKQAALQFALAKSRRALAHFDALPMAIRAMPTITVVKHSGCGKTEASLEILDGRGR